MISSSLKLATNHNPKEVEPNRTISLSKSTDDNGTPIYTTPSPKYEFEQRQSGRQLRRPV